MIRFTSDKRQTANELHDHLTALGFSPSTSSKGEMDFQFGKTENERLPENITLIYSDSSREFAVKVEDAYLFEGEAGEFVLTLAWLSQEVVHLNKLLKEIIR